MQDEKRRRSLKQFDDFTTDFEEKLRIRKYASTSAIRTLRLDQKCRISNTKKMITRFFMVPPPDII